MGEDEGTKPKIETCRHSGWKDGLTYCKKRMARTTSALCAVCRLYAPPGKAGERRPR